MHSTTPRRLNWSRCLIFVAPLLLCVTSSASAQEQTSLKIPTVVFFSAAAADWVTTGATLSQPGFEEKNPLLKFTNNDPAGTVTALVASDVLGALVINKWIAPRKPKLAKVLLYSFAAARVSMAVHNVRALAARTR